MASLLSGIVTKFRTSYWLSSGFFTFLGKISTTLFGLINFMILVRLLNKDDYGVWVLFISIGTLMELIKHGFVRNPLLRYLNVSDQKDDRSIQTASLYLNALIAVFQVAVLVGFSFFLSQFWKAPQLQSLFLIYIFTTLVFIPANHFDIVQQARMHFKGTFFSTFTRQFGLFVYIVLAALLDWQVTLNMLAFVQLGSMVASCVISYIFAKRFIALSLTLDKRWMKELFHYGKYTFGTNVSSMIVKNVDTWMLGRMISPAAVTIFNPAIRLSNLVEVPTDTLTSILFPKLSSRVAAEGLDSARHLYERAVGVILAIMIPMVLFVIVFAEPIIFLITGPGFEETVPILQVTMLYGLIIPFNRFLGITLDAIGMARANFSIVLQTALVNALSNYFFITNFGIIGAAYGTLFTYTLALTYNQVYLHRKLGVRLKGIFYHLFNTYIGLFSKGFKALKADR